MRTTFIDTLCAAAAANPRIWLLCADLGFSVLERFAERFPQRFVNIGVAEQNMIGVAAGLALAGKAVVTYSIGNFSLMRCLEQIRNDVGYHGLNVKIVAVGGGLAYGALGYTHHAVEDLAVMQAMPNIKVFAPGDPIETRLVTKAMLEDDGPCYLRLGKAGEPTVHGVEPDFAVGKALLVREGSDVTLVSTGGSLHTVVAAADRLSGAGVSAKVLSMPTLRPLDEKALLSAALETSLLATVEEHSPTGGLHASVCALLGQEGVPRRCLRFAVPPQTRAMVGSQPYLTRLCGLDAASVADQILAHFPLRT